MCMPKMSEPVHYTIDIKNIDGNGKAIRSQMVNGNT